ncbi:uncharacterized protein LOC128224291 [Mya arenaria]|uniref:uncharacterized protein LOC128224291 n=1 Tax=Mya arenaria TaxID=6604 RepID=UPI0022E8A884|nr:uncharacterized protein LOC128224291 [Mya arenaria]
MYSTLAEQGRFKRVLLHGDGDLAAAVQLLTTQVNQLSSEVTNIKQQNSQLLTHNSELESKISQMQSSFDQHSADSSSHQNGGAVYIRWGRTVCPLNGTDLVYNVVPGGAPIPGSTYVSWKIKGTSLESQKEKKKIDKCTPV